MIIGLRKKEVPSNAKKGIKFGSIIEGTESTIMQSLYVLKCVFFLLQMKVECISVLARRLQTPLASGSRKLLILFADEAYLTIASSLNPKILFSLLTHWYDVILCERLTSHFKKFGHEECLEL